MDGPPDPEKAKPPEPGSLAAEGLGVSELADLGQKLKRYGTAKARARTMAGYLVSVLNGAPEGVFPVRRKITLHERQQVRRLTQRLYDCGSFLLFRHYLEHRKTQLIRSSSCYAHLLCPLCAIRRAAAHLRRYHERFAYLAGRFDFYLVTLTVKNGDDLAERFGHLRSAIRRLRDRARKGYGALAPMAGALWSFELTRSQHGWHPHCHAIVVMPKGHPPLRYGEGSQLREDWHAVTGDSFITHAELIGSDDESILGGLSEVLKYALKFADLDPADNWEAYRTLKGARLVAASGVLYGLLLPDDAALDDVPLDGPYVEWLMRYGSQGYSMDGAPRRVEVGLTSDAMEVHHA